MQDNAALVTDDYQAVQNDASNGNVKRRIVAALASTLLPGVGQLLLEQRRAAVIFGTASFAIALGYWPLRFPNTWLALLVLILASLLICMVAAWHALRSSSHVAVKASKWWLALLLPLALLTASLHSNWLLIAAGFRVFNVPSTSMEPTILANERVLVDLRAYRDSKARPGEIVVMKGNDSQSYFTCKRVITVGGHSISGINDTVFVDGIALTEPYANLTDCSLPELSNFGPVHIPPGAIFVIGDNRGVSYDSRLPEVGPISEDRVVGRALYVLRSEAPGRSGKDLRN